MKSVVSADVNDAEDPEQKAATEGKGDKEKELPSDAAAPRNGAQDDRPEPESVD